MVLNPSSSLLASQDETKASESILIYSMFLIQSVQPKWTLGRLVLSASWWSAWLSQAFIGGLWVHLKLC